MSALIPTAIELSVGLSDLSPRRVANEFRHLLNAGATFLPVGEGKQDPDALLKPRYMPRHKFELFGTTFYVSRALQNPALRFVIAYITQQNPRTGRVRIHPRIFYKDLSLIWRCASHVIATEDEFWIGKGDVRTVVEGEQEFLDSMEETTDLPLEIQQALETINRANRKVPTDEEALYLVLQPAPNGRIVPFREFTDIRRRAAANKRNLIHSGRPIARFARRNDPTSLKIVKGFEPDFNKGIVEEGHSRSAMYGGDLKRYRILSKNKKIQYLFIAAEKHIWIIPPQATTTQLSSFGLRTINVLADEDLFVPGFEYHYCPDDVDPCEHFTQIPKGYAGAQSEHDGDRADATAWLNKIPVIVDFKKAILSRKR